MTGLSAIASRFDLFLIDQFGVLHDGQTPYAHALDAMSRLRALGKSTILLTNSGKRSQPNADRMIRMGFPAGSFTHVVSSGEVCWHAIRDGRLGPPFQRGARVHLIGKTGDDYGLAGLDLTLTDAPETAEFVLILGTDVPSVTLDQYRRRLATAARDGIPALCANPDRYMLSPAGLLPAPGAIADLYAELGGNVAFTGKPYPDIYRFALGLAPGVAKERILAIGDSIEHDIAGAARFGLPSALIRTGVLADFDGPTLERLYAEHNARPNFVLERLEW
jgi:HAD superfamily hydrolase (TIGR01459 family)